MIKSAIVIGVRTAPKQLCPVSIGRHGSGIRFQICVCTEPTTHPRPATKENGALTTDRHLGVTLPAGDWTLAGFDLTMLALGAAFGYMAVKVKRRWLAKMTDGAPTGHSTLAGGTR